MLAGWRLPPALCITRSKVEGTKANGPGTGLIRCMSRHQASELAAVPADEIFTRLKLQCLFSTITNFVFPILRPRPHPGKPGFLLPSHRISDFPIIPALKTSAVCFPQEEDETPTVYRSLSQLNGPVERPFTESNCN